MCAQSDLLIKRVVQGVMPVGLQCTPAVMDVSGTKAKRRVNHERSSRERRAVEPMLQVGDWLVIMDQYPDYNFCTPYEKEVVRVRGTMISVRKGSREVSRNVLRFKRIDEKSTQDGSAETAGDLYEVREVESSHPTSENSWSPLRLKGAAVATSAEVVQQTRPSQTILM
ncbi:hypothetical protein NDU88_003229 [Pleurodeles waltl]|uniref:Uncharacterized protein n=1 Tax=Pleurodeles waltl TaxID=8319 RepID=A0AAV7UC66_PLEWA|nr:hypothetical protein NDU88_003229 [Pleurodeles waltl]